MELIFEKVRACGATMSIIDSKIAAFRPISHIFATCGLCHVQNNRDSVLIVIPLDALMRVSCVRSDQAMRLRCILGRFEIFKRIGYRLWQLEINFDHLRDRGCSKIVIGSWLRSCTCGRLWLIITSVWVLNIFRLRQDFIWASCAWEYIQLFFGSRLGWCVRGNLMLS